MLQEGMHGHNVLQILAPLKLYSLINFTGHNDGMSEHIPMPEKQIACAPRSRLGNLAMFTFVTSPVSIATRFLLCTAHNIQIYVHVNLRCQLFSD